MHMALHEISPDNLDRGPAHRRDEVLGAHVNHPLNLALLGLLLGRIRPNTSF